MITNRIFFKFCMVLNLLFLIAAILILAFADNLNTAFIILFIAVAFNIIALILRLGIMYNRRVYGFEINKAVETENEVNDERYSRHLSDFLRQIAVLRWGDDANKLDSRINDLRNDPFLRNSFYVYATKEKADAAMGYSREKNNMIGFAYVCQDETNENHWYYDLVIQPKHKRSGIAERMIDYVIMNIRSMITANKQSETPKLFTYIDKDDPSILKLHKKLSERGYEFFPSERQENINGFDKGGRIVYECIIKAR